ncbi:conserved hypothetical protein [Ricinus communis]|uniref:RNase H type-1 domain-containing protein n=1 Tax=Ricinus communis TaxID=3988 RepID=B9SFH5_RICCO|nr:conserved hypothetical protein [Ricinus communis]
MGGSEDQSWREVDKECLLNILLKSSSPTMKYMALFKEAQVSDWVAKISHVYREANWWADKLANIGHDLPLGCHVFEVPHDADKEFDCRSAHKDTAAICR